MCLMTARSCSAHARAPSSGKVDGPRRYDPPGAGTTRASVRASLGAALHGTRPSRSGALQDTWRRAAAGADPRRHGDRSRPGAPRHAGRSHRGRPCRRPRGAPRTGPRRGGRGRAGPPRHAGPHRSSRPRLLRRLHYGIEPDPHCLATGTTTVVDAGSAGALTFPAFRKYVIEVAATRILPFLNIGATGMLSAEVGELEELRFIDRTKALLVYRSEPRPDPRR